MDDMRAPQKRGQGILGPSGNFQYKYYFIIIG